MLTPGRVGGMSKRSKNEFDKLNYPVMRRNSGLKKTLMSMDLKSDDNFSLPGQSVDTGYQISETVVTKTKVTHSTKNTNTVYL